METAQIFDTFRVEQKGQSGRKENWSCWLLVGWHPEHCFAWKAASVVGLVFFYLTDCSCMPIRYSDVSAELNSWSCHTHLDSLGDSGNWNQESLTPDGATMPLSDHAETQNLREYS